MIAPHSLESEQSILGALLLSDRAMYAVRMEEGLREADFFSPRHRLVYRAMCALDDSDGSFDRVAVSDWLDHNGLISEVGQDMLDQLTGPFAAAGNVRQYVRAVRDFAIMRGIIAAALDLQGKVDSRKVEPRELVDQAVAAFMDLADDPRRQAKRIGDVTRRVIEDTVARTEQQEVTGVPSGFPVLDRATGGFQKGKVYVIAARPAMGKSSLVTQVAVNASSVGAVTGLWSLEMGDEEVGERVLSLASQIPATRLKRGGLRDSSVRRLMDAGQKVDGLPLWLDDNPELSATDFRAKARRLKQRAGLDLAMVDFLQIMKTEGGENRTQEVTRLTRAFKVVAKQLDIPIIVLSQLSRKVEDRGQSLDSKKPQLSDLRESGSIEQDADCVMFMFREGYYDKDSPRADMTDIAIAKARGFATVDYPAEGYPGISLRWDGPTMSFAPGS